MNSLRNGGEKLLMVNKAPHNLGRRKEEWGMRSEYCNFRSFTRMADYPHESIFAITKKKFQQITCTGKQEEIVDSHKVPSLFLLIWYLLRAINKFSHFLRDTNWECPLRHGFLQRNCLLPILWPHAEDCAEREGLPHGSDKQVILNNNLITLLLCTRNKFRTHFVHNSDSCPLTTFPLTVILEVHNDWYMPGCFDKFHEIFGFHACCCFVSHRMEMHFLVIILHKTCV